MLLVPAGTQNAFATFHLWEITEVFSNADGTIQYIELSTSFSSQTQVQGRTITTLGKSFVFPMGALPGDTAGKTLLLGTACFAAQSGASPDFVIPSNFFDINIDTITFVGADSVTYVLGLPTDGLTALYFTASGITSVAPASPQNFAGEVSGGPFNTLCVDVPTANPDSFLTDEDTLLSVPAPGVLGNDIDPEDDPLSAILVSTTTSGDLTFNSDGSFEYMPNPNFNGVDSFTYKANDGESNSITTTVTITVNAIDDAITCGPGTIQQGNECGPDLSQICGLNTFESGGQCLPVSSLAFCGEKTIQVGGFCVPDILAICAEGTIADENVFMCFAQTMGSMIGGALLDIDTTALLVAAVGTNPVITGLVAITLAGVAGQAVWFVHKRRKEQKD